MKTDVERRARLGIAFILFLLALAFGLPQLLCRSKAAPITPEMARLTTQATASQPTSEPAESDEPE